MSFKHSSAVRTLKGKSVCRFRKCRFSVTNTSAPTHSVYAAIKASAGLSPLISYLTPNSKGIKKSSSIMVTSEMNSKNSRKTSWTKLRLTSSTIVRGIRSLYSEGEIASKLIIDLQDGFTEVAKAYIYIRLYQEREASFSSQISSRVLRSFFITSSSLMPSKGDFL